MAKQINVIARTQNVEITNLVEKLDGNIILDYSFYIKYNNALKHFEKAKEELESLIKSGG